MLGFSAVFAIEALALSSAALTLRDDDQLLTRILGGVIIVLGLMFVGAFDRFSFSGRIFRPQFRPRAGLAGAPLLGAVFGLGWTPCIGPTLAAVLSLGVTTGSSGRAVVLAFVYALGLGVPFLLVAVAFQRGISLFGFFRRHGRAHYPDRRRHADRGGAAGGHRGLGQRRGLAADPLAGRVQPPDLAPGGSAGARRHCQYLGG